MSNIHPTAIIAPTAEIEDGVAIGPYCVIEGDTVIKSGTSLQAHVIIQRYTQIGRNNVIHGNANLGGLPQDTKFKGERSYLLIGDDNMIRESVTIHRATGEDNVTRIGNHNMLMAYVHIGHNCEIENYVTLASYAGISGHVNIEDYATFGGFSGAHQFTSVGTLAMIAAFSGILQDVPPYMLAEGRPTRIYDINKIGLRRAGIPLKVRNELRQAYKLLYRSNLNMAQALDAIETDIPKSAELDHLLEFIHRSRRGKNGRGNM